MGARLHVFVSPLEEQTLSTGQKLETYLEIGFHGEYYLYA